MTRPDPAARLLPPGFPMPDPQTMDTLRRSIMQETKTAHPPLAAELALLITADEAGIDLSAIDALGVWQNPSEDREPLFVMISQLLGEL